MRGVAGDPQLDSSKGCAESAESAESAKNAKNMKHRRIAERWTANADHVAAIESASASVKPDADALLPWYEVYSAKQKKRLAFDLGYVERFARREDVVLEFGAMPPILTVALTRRGYSVCGLDLAPARFQAVVRAEKLNVKEVDFEVAPLPFEDDAVDVVIFHEVFEHLRINPIFTFSEISRVLRTQGTLLLSTPNLTSWKGWYNFAVKGRLPVDVYDAYERLDTIGHMGHVRLYSPPEVTAFLERMGFAVQLIIHRGEWQSPSAWARALANLLSRLFPKRRASFSVVAKKVSKPAD